MKTKLLLLTVKTISSMFMITMICVLVFIQEARSQSSVYIDPTYTGGLNNGSLAHPYMHWNDVPGVPNNLIDNTSYLQKRGTKDSINGSIHPYQKTGITFGVYGTGTDYAHLHNKSVGNDKTFNITASNHISVDGYHLTGSYTTTSGVSVSNDWDPASTYVGNNIRVTNCFIEKFLSGIKAFKYATSPFDTLVIDNVRIHDIFEDGIYIQTVSNDTIPLYGLDINNCYIDSVNRGYSINGGDETVNPGDGIQLVNLVADWKIRNTTIDRRNSSNKFCFIFGQESAKETCNQCFYNGLIENCTFYTPNLGFGGCAMYLDHINVVVKNNHVFCDELSTIMMTRSNTLLTCYYNTFSKMTTMARIGFDMMGSGHNLFHNNTLYGIQKVFITSGISTDVYNNIFSNTGTVYQNPVLTSPDNNLYFNAIVSGTEPHSIYNQDPMLANPLIGDFRLRAGTPCLDKGRNLGYTSDIAGTALPQGTGYDIGAYEYISTNTIAPTAPLGLAASDITYTSFTLAWNASTDDVGVTGYDVYKNGTLITSVSGTLSNITGLTQGTTYSMTIKAKDGDGNISPLSIPLPVITTVSSDTQAPSIPAGLTASGIGQSKFNLSWTASTDNVGVRAYDVYKDGALVASVTGTKVNITGLAPNVTYYMTIKAKDAEGNTSESTALPVTTMALCTGTDAWNSKGFINQTGTFTAEYDVMAQGESVVAVIGLSDGAVTSFGNLACISTFMADGTVKARNSGVYSSVNNFQYAAGITYHVKMVVNVVTKLYDVFIKEAGGSEETIIASQYGFRAQAIQLNNLTEESDACHVTISNFSASPTTDTLAPGTPVGMATSNISSTGFTLSWDASTDDTGVTGYDVFKDGVLYTAVVGTSANITSLNPASAYYMTVRSKDGSANVSAFSTALSVSTLSDTQAPSIPDELISGNLTETDFILTWNASTDDVGVTGYDVYKDGTLLTTVAGTSTTITGLSAGTIYSITLKAKDAASNISAASNALSVTTLDTHLPSVPTGLTLGDITFTSFILRWDASTDNVGVTGYNVYSNGLFAVSVTGTSANITGLIPGSTYSMTVMAKDAAGNISAASLALPVTTLSDIQLPTVPAGLISSNITTTGFTLGWNASTDNVGVSGYDVYMNGTLYASIAETSIGITGLAAGSTYSMTVLAKDAASNLSGASDALSVTTIALCLGTDPWNSRVFSIQTQTFTAEYDVVPQSGSVIAVMGLSDGAVTSFGNLACIVSFIANGTVKARNIGVYSSDNNFQYVAGIKYHIKMVVNVATKLYDVIINEAGGTGETIIASQYGFRSQAIQLNNLTEESDACHVTVSNLSVISIPVTSVRTFADKTIIVYPNPASDMVYIKVEGPSTVSIFNIEGKLVVNKIIEGTTSLPLDLESGVYLIRINMENKTVHTEKLIIK